MDGNNDENGEHEPITVESIIQNKILLNTTPENQELARAILEFMGEEYELEDEGLDFVRILNNNLAQGIYLEKEKKNCAEMIICETKVSTLTTVLSKEGDFEDPRGILWKNGELFVADGGLETIVQLNSDKSIKKLCSDGTLKWPIGVCSGFGENEILISDVTNNVIVSVNTVTSESKIFAGCGKQGNKDGDLDKCEFNGPRGIYKDKNRIIICDSNNNSLRVIQNNQIKTLISKSECLHLPTGVCVDNVGNIYICDCENHCIQMLSVEGTLSIVAGESGVAGHHDGPAKDSLLNWPYSVVNIHGNFIFCEAGNGALRILKKDGTVTTLIRGVGNKIKLNDREKTMLFGNDLCLGAPRGLFADENYSLYVTESMSSRVSRVNPIDWETAKWIILISHNDNLMSRELLPELFQYLAWIAYTSWRF